MNPRDDTMRAAARGSCWPRSGVGSFLVVVVLVDELLSKD